MREIRFTQLDFAGYERKFKKVVDEYRVTKNQNGTYNIICTIAGNQFIYNDCTYPDESMYMKLVRGRFFEGETVTVKIDRKLIERKVRYNRADGLYIVYQNMKYFKNELEEKA